MGKMRAYGPDDEVSPNVQQERHVGPQRQVSGRHLPGRSAGLEHEQARHDHAQCGLGGRPQEDVAQNEALRVLYPVQGGCDQERAPAQKVESLNHPAEDHSTTPPSSATRQRQPTPQPPSLAWQILLQVCPGAQGSEETQGETEGLASQKGAPAEQSVEEVQHVSGD